jgi:hypothetical protein
MKYPYTDTNVTINFPKWGHNNSAPAMNREAKEDASSFIDLSSLVTEMA